MKVKYIGKFDTIAFEKSKYIMSYLSKKAGIESLQNSMTIIFPPRTV